MTLSEQTADYRRFMRNIPAVMLINPPGIPKITEYMRRAPPRKRPSADGDFKARNRRGNGKAISSAPVPARVQPSTFVASGSLFNLHDNRGVTANSEKIKIKSGTLL